MTDSFFLFVLLSTMIFPMLTAWLVLRNVHQSKFLLNWGPFVVLFSIIASFTIPLWSARMWIIPKYGTTEIYDAVEIREEINNTEIVQYLVYEDGSEINLTEKTGKYYTEMPNSQREREYCTFLWVVNYDQTWTKGLDFVDRD